MIIQLPVSDYERMGAAEVLFDLEKGELWINAKHLPKQALWHICLTTLELYRKKGQTYLPMEWCAYKWAGPTDLIGALRVRYQVEMAQLEEYREKHKPVEVIDVGDIEQKSDSQHRPCDEHPSGWELPSICSEGQCGT